eukprot:1676429-Pleurochrysis_carterae.AAC.1
MERGRGRPSPRHGAHGASARLHAALSFGKACIEVSRGAHLDPSLGEERAGDEDEGEVDDGAQRVEQHLRARAACRHIGRRRHAHDI